MGLIIPRDIGSTIKYTKDKLSKLLAAFYSLDNDMRYVLICVLISHILALYVKDQINKGNKEIISKVGKEDPIYININSIMYMYSGKIDVITLIQALHQLRNDLAHDYPVPYTIRDMDKVLSRESDLRELCSILGIEMQQKSVTMFTAANLMTGE